jgi:hypothetical protein
VVTYNPREELHLEQRVQDYLDERHRILSLSGPTKCGKTVLLKRIVPTDCAWISGGSIATSAEFWELVADKLGLYGKNTTEYGSAEADGTEVEGGGRVGIPGIATAGAKGKASFETTKTTRQSVSRDRPLVNLVSEELRENKIPIIIDDFHYLPAKVQLEIVRGLKELVFEGVPVIFASVPHRAFDAVRVEKEMTGRVEQLGIGFWSEQELAGIATQGIAALNAEVDGSVVERLIREAFQSPHLMQDFCLNLCKASGVRESQGEVQKIAAPDWSEFFASRAPGASKSAFELLVQGPRQRSDRMERVLVDGTTTDIYGVVLAGIAATGPLTALDYLELRTSIKDVLRSDAPAHHEVTRVLEKMAQIARDDIEGEPVVDYDDERNTLFISDPFFAYYLRWGTDPPLAAVRPNGSS